MEKLRTPEDLEALSTSICRAQNPDIKRVRICMTGCRAYGAEEIRDAFPTRIDVVKTAGGSTLEVS